MNKMDHSYAREKLTLLLRDLDSYTAGEFWRQMSRIANGASKLESAEQLKQERDQLAAQNARLREGLNQSIELLVTAIHEPEQITEPEIHDLRTLELETPAASLASIQADAIERAAKLYSHKWEEEFKEVTISTMRGGIGYIYPEGLLEHANAIRQSAKQSGEK
jgi:hypothetical protein